MKLRKIRRFNIVLSILSISLAWCAALFVATPASASNWSENTQADFSGGYFFHTTSTVDSNYILMTEWNDWYSDSWNSRRKININNAAGGAVDLLNYQIDLYVDTKALIDSSRMREDMKDIRFADEDGRTLIPYYVHNASGTATRITVKVPSVAAGTQRVIYMYYNNAASSTSLSNIQAVYDLYEDWETGSIDGKWTRGGAAMFNVVTENKYAGNYSIQSGSVSLNQVSYLSVSINTDMTAALTFFWAINGTGSNQDYMQCWIDDVLQMQITGVQNWAKRTHLELSAGNHTIKWLYNRGGFNQNLGLGWVDNIAVQKYTAVPPSVVIDPIGSEESHTAFYRSALYQSRIFDTGGEDSIVDLVSWTVTNHGASNVAVKMRSSNTAFVVNTSSAALPWGNQIINGQGTPPVANGRYLQYLTEFTGDGTTTSFLLGMSVTYRSPPPRPTGFSGVVISSTNIKWSWTDNASGLLQEQGITIFTSTGGFIKHLEPDTVEWTETGLSPNNIFSRCVGYYNAVGTNTSTSASYCTMAEVPVATAEAFGFLSGSGYQYTLIPDSTELFASSFTFTSEKSTGAIEYYRIAFNTSATHSFTSGDTAWVPMVSTVTHPDSGSVITKKPEVILKAAANSDTWYFHAQSYNKAAQASGAVHLGPFFFRGAPSQITDLAALPAIDKEGKITLSWSAPGANGAGNENIAGGKFMIKGRRDYLLTTEEQFNGAEYSLTVTTSVTKGSYVNYTVTGLTPGTTWGFAIKAVDSEDNYSLLSTNVDNAYNTRTTASKVAKIVFINQPLQTYVGLATSKLTIESRDGGDNPMKLAAETYIYFNSSSGNGEFSLLPSPWVNTNFVSIPAGETRAEFYYKDINSGAQTMGVYELPSQSWTSGSQAVTILPGKAVQYLVETVASRTIGQTASVIIRANDGYNASNTSIDYLGMAVVSATVAGSVLTPSDLSFTSDKAGQITATWNNSQNIAGQGYVTVREVVGQRYTDVFFSDTLNGIVCGSEGMIKKTGNGGSQWFAMRYTTGTENGINGIATDASGSTVVAAGKTGIVYVSTDSAMTFTAVNTGLGQDLNAVVYIGTMTVFAAGNNGKIGKSLDGGQTWSDISPATVENLNSVHFISTTTGFAAGSSRTVLKTLNAGSSWSAVSLPGSSSEELKKITFYDETNGFIAGEDGKIYATTDGGTNWTDVSPAGITDDLSCVSFISADRGIAVGVNSTILRTIDGGSTWTRLVSTGTETFTSVHYAGNNANVAAVAGYRTEDNAGVLYQTQDGGSTWSAIVMQGQSSTVNWNGLVINAQGTASRLYQRRTKQSAVKVTTKNAFGGSSTISQLSVRIAGGTGSYTDIAAVQLYRDKNNNGVLDDSDQKLGGSAIPSTDGLAIINGFSNTLTNEATYFVAVDVANDAVIGKTIGFSFDSVCLNVTGVPLASNNLPAVITPVEIVPSSVTINMNISNVSPLEAKQGQRNVLVSSFSMITARGDSEWTRLIVSRTGVNNNDSDIEAVKLYASATPSFEDAGGVPISSAAFGALSAGAAYLNLSQTINDYTTNYYFLAVDISPNAAFWTTESDARFWLAFSVSTTSFRLDSGGSNGLSCSTGTFTSNQIKIVQAFDTLTVDPLGSIPDFDIQQSVNKLIMPLTMNVSEDGGQVSLVKLRLAEAGTAADSDVSAVELYRDTNANGVYDPPADTLIGASVFSGSVADIILPTPESISKTSVGVNYFIAVTIAKRAVAGRTVTLHVDTDGYTLAGSDIVSATHSAFTSPAGTITNYRDVVSCAFSSLAPSEVRVDETGVAVSRMTLNAYCGATLIRMIVEYAGSGSVSDVGLIKVYRADDGSGNASDEVLIGTATFAGNGKGTVNFAVPPVIYDSSATFVVRYDLNTNATPAKTLGMGIADTDLVFTGGDSAYEFGYHYTSLMNLLNKEAPSQPAVTLNIGWPSGRTSGGHTTYFVSNPNEISFSWDAAALSGIAQTQYALASFRVFSSTDVPDITAWSSTTDRTALLSEINMRHNQTYYFWVKAISGNGYERVTCCEIKADLTEPTAPGEPRDTSPKRNAAVEKAVTTPVSYWVSWDASSEDVSGVLYYEIQERADTSPAWVTIATTTASEYRVIKDSFTDSGRFFYYRIRSRNYAGAYSGYSGSSNAAYLRLPGELISDLCSYPNPFDSRVRSATIAFVLNQSATVSFKIYDLFGGLVREWKYDGAAGENRVAWDGTDGDGRKVAAGMYILYTETRSSDTTVKKRWKIGVIH